ncbi:MAG: EAL domain-containing protein [Acidobacteria bacterium]|nr:EAL domain-containing protein [Acidobacteriota bacterium]
MIGAWTPSRRSATIAVAFLAALAVLAPTVLAIVAAYRSGLDAERGRVAGYAQDVLVRNDAITDQELAAFQRLRATGREFGPCSSENVATMRQLDVSSSTLQALGRVQGNRLTCTSLGALNVTLPPVDLIGGLGAKIRAKVMLPIAPGVTFKMVELYGYACVVSADIAIDFPVHDEDISLATYSTVNGTLYASKGAIDPSWARVHVAAGDQRTFAAHGRLVTVTRSSRWLSGSIASISAGHINDRARRAALLLVPFAVVIGGLLAVGIVVLGRAQQAMPAVLRAAFKNHEFYVEYQPVVELPSGRWTGAEALIRWTRSSGERVRPDLFMPLIEDSGLGPQLTTHVLELIRDEVAEIFRRFPDFKLHVNLTPEDLRRSETVDMLHEFAVATGASSRSLSVEATERDFLDHERAPGIVRALGVHGISVVIDDFGTGYSSLSYLERYDFDGIKIDKSFVDTLGTEAVASQVIFQIIRMGLELNYEMVAEGVEHREQAVLLHDAGVRYAQGWFYAKSMSFDELMTGLTSEPVSV